MNKALDYPFNLLDEVFEGDAETLEALENIADFKGSLAYVLSTLTEREQIILYKRYQEGKTYLVIGDEFGVTRERIRQVEAKAVRKLKHPSRRKFLEKGIAGIIQELKIEANNRYIELQSRFIAVCEANTAVADKVIQDAETRRIYKSGDITECDFSVRTYHCLSRAGYTHLLEIAEAPAETILHVRNLGRKSYLEIIEKLEAHGYSAEHLRRAVCKND